MVIHQKASTYSVTYEMPPHAKQLAKSASPLLRFRPGKIEFPLPSSLGPSPRTQIALRPHLTLPSPTPKKDTLHSPSLERIDIYTYDGDGAPGLCLRQSRDSTQFEQMRSPGITTTASDAHRIAELATPNVELVDVYASPRKGEINSLLGPTFRSEPRFESQQHLELFPHSMLLHGRLVFLIVFLRIYVLFYLRNHPCNDRLLVVAGVVSTEIGRPFDNSGPEGYMNEGLRLVSYQ